MDVRGGRSLALTQIPAYATYLLYTHILRPYVFGRGAAPAARTTHTAAAKDELPPLLHPDDVVQRTTLQQPQLTFDLQEAKAYLCARDPRFVSLFAQMDLKTYEELRDGEVKELNLFRVLVTALKPVLPATAAQAKAPTM